MIIDAAMGIRQLYRSTSGTKVRTSDYLGWIPDVPKKSDYPYASVMVGVSGGRLPLMPLPMVGEFPTSAVARNLKRMALFDQGPRGSCTGQAAANMHGIVRDVTPRSAMFVYAEARKKINELNQDNGAYTRDAVSTLCDLGVPRDDLWADTQDNLYLDPTERADLDATKRRVAQYYRMETRDDILHCIAQGYPFVFGVSVFDSLFDHGEYGYIPYPNYEREAWWGGHCMMGFGYHLQFSQTDIGKALSDQYGHAVEDEVVKGRNSWGRWGYQGSGDFYIPIRLLTDRDLCDDLWTIRRTLATATR